MILYVWPRHQSAHLTLLRIRLAFKAAFFFLIVNCPAENVSPEYFGLHIHRADNTTAWPTVRFGSLRLWDAHVQWADLQTSKKTWRFGRLDHLVELAAANNVSVLLPLGLSPHWASARPEEPSPYGNGKAAEPRAIEDWRIYVRTVAQRYKGKIGAYEIWNEPNDKAFFSGSSAKLLELTCEAYRILKAVDPTLVVVSPAYTGAQNVHKLDEFLATGGDECIDVVAYHLYLPDRPPEAIPSLIGDIRRIMEQRAVGHLPLWNTESGWVIKNISAIPEANIPDYWLRVSMAQSANFVARALLLGSAFGIDRFYWYAWDSKFMGLVEPTTKALKPGGVTLGVLGRWMTDGPRPACTEISEIWVCTLSVAPDEQRVVVWSTGRPGEYTVPTGWRIRKIERADGQTELLTSVTTIRTDGLPRQLTLAPKL